uniref:Uncharacterized protein n=1 Tax=Cacopsylla melanoneura TaxID=428564 RepID=A0A8D8SR82_9HEMI
MNPGASRHFVLFTYSIKKYHIYVHNSLRQKKFDYNRKKKGKHYTTLYCLLYKMRWAHYVRMGSRIPVYLLHRRLVCIRPWTPVPDLEFNFPYPIEIIFW